MRALPCETAFYFDIMTKRRGISLVVKQQFSKLWSGVRFSYPAKEKMVSKLGMPPCCKFHFCPKTYQIQF